ncbi:type II toxin-antitoxin system RelE family toxin, partial [Vibrio mediterranei]|uniref:type II toxin-antitoxin system RelE family toxin n=1 Tax=Vibrio mediterranei TaxID=689 RepID=UPI004068143C
VRSGSVHSSDSSNSKNWSAEVFSLLNGMPNCYKIKLRSVGYRLVYEVRDDEVVVSIVAVGKRERNEVYKTAIKRI